MLFLLSWIHNTLPGFLGGIWSKLGPRSVRASKDKQDKRKRAKRRAKRKSKKKSKKLLLAPTKPQKTQGISSRRTELQTQITSLQRHCNITSTSLQQYYSNITATSHLCNITSLQHHISATSHHYNITTTSCNIIAISCDITVTSLQHHF